MVPNWQWKLPITAHRKHLSTSLSIQAVLLYPGRSVRQHNEARTHTDEQAKVGGGVAREGVADPCTPPSFQQAHRRVFGKICQSGLLRKSLLRMNIYPD